MLSQRKPRDAAVSFDTCCIGNIMIIILRIKLKIVIINGDFVTVLCAEVTDCVPRITIPLSFIENADKCVYDPTIE